MPIKPMSPSAAIEELERSGFWADENGNSFFHLDEPTLRTALASVLAWAAEDCRPTLEQLAQAFIQGDVTANDVYHTALLKAAEEIKTH